MRERNGVGLRRLPMFPVSVAGDKEERIKRVCRFFRAQKQRRPEENMSKTGKFRFSIDRGGTFTDVFAQCPSGSVRTYKLLSKHTCYQDAPTEGIRRIIEMESGKTLQPDAPIDSSLIESIRMGTTVATNALLERKGERTGLLITKGFRDLLHIGNQARPNIFDLSIAIPEHLYCEVVEVDERVVLESDQCELKLKQGDSVSLPSHSVNVVRKLDLEVLEGDLKKLLEKDVRSIAVVLMHSWVVRQPREADRAARLGPRVQARQHLQLCHEDGSAGAGSAVGPCRRGRGYARTVFDKYGIPVIGFDMGGTSTDVSRFDGEFIHTFESVTAGVPLQCPQLDIQTVAAGGGSILTFSSGIYNVGPESAGANPGPVAYDHGGELLTITDANLILNRLLPSRFPKIFGPTHDSELNATKTLEKFKQLRSKINAFNEAHGLEPLNVEEIALGFIRVANETMARPIRNITQGKGFDPSTHMLACFGGAGGQHACAIAKSLGIKLVSVPRYAGILSAVGIFLADVVIEENEPVGLLITDDNYSRTNELVEHRFKVICEELGAKLKSEGNYSELKFEKYLNIRYSGTDCALMVKDSPPLKNFTARFVDEYSRQFGFQLQRELVLDDIRVRAVGVNEIIHENEKQEEISTLPLGTINAYFNTGSHETPYVACVPGIYRGPCLILDNLSTIVVEPGWVATVSDKDVKLEFEVLKNENEETRPIVLDSIMLSIFSHRFMSIAEQMGRILQRTSVSTNIKERLDFSCAIFGPDGGLVSNAPHIPVHPGPCRRLCSISYALLRGVAASSVGVMGFLLVRCCCPGMDCDPSSPIFFVANRGHHADIGGITPGSMPPNSKSIHEEGAVFKSFKLVREGNFMEEQLVAELMKPGEYPGSSGTRNLSDNLSDLRAQVAANQKVGHPAPPLPDIGVLAPVRPEVHAVHPGERGGGGSRNAEDSGGKLLPKIIRLRVHGRRKRNSANSEHKQARGLCNVRLHGNNLPGDWELQRSESNYVISSDLLPPVPRRKGHPAEPRVLKANTHNHPGRKHPPPLRGRCSGWGNVLTSQRVVDVILKAFEACAASQGCMNNITFGDNTLGYYETVAGGAGAGPTWEGRSGVHTHMTNTRITDPEILELRYPVLLHHFSLEKHSGGVGKFRGGDGVRREILFRKHMKLSVLTERRVFTPYGLKEGGDGKRGRNLLVKNAWRDQSKGKIINLGGKTSVDVEPGDMFTLISPGGGAWGKL
ncbi:5-oxoprolinase [Orchesella cincta]|uniref:5-oxoprolinase n=1 Tax=Orchesella cincta TaxID=48709 RepID=A0A1D2MJ24_ORCCI|nr:5-oxoprolinase [Orchesella cincta]